MCRIQATRLGYALVLCAFALVLAAPRAGAQTICQVCFEGCDADLQLCLDAGNDPTTCFAQLKACRRICKLTCNRTLASVQAAGAPVTPALASEAKIIGPILPDPECLAACDAENESCLAAGIPALQCAKATLRCKQRCTIFPGGF